MRTDVTPSEAGYAKALAAAAQQRAYALALEADEAIERAEAGGWMDQPTGEALAATDAADAALGDCIAAGRRSWEADRMVAAGQPRPPRAVQTVGLPELEAG
jgi:hypothetical protein